MNAAWLRPTRPTHLPRESLGELDDPPDACCD